MTEELPNWPNIGIIQKSHKSSLEHTTYMSAWKDFEVLVQTVRTPDQAERTLLDAEKVHWKDVLTCLIRSIDI